MVMGAGSGFAKLAALSCAGTGLATTDDSLVSVQIRERLVLS
jgi:hypothetical protein